MVGDKVSNAYFGVRASEKEVSEKIHMGVRNYFYDKAFLVKSHKKRAYTHFNYPDKAEARDVGMWGLQRYLIYMGSCYLRERKGQKIVEERE